MADGEEPSTVRARVGARLERLDTLNHYQLLELAQGAPAEELQAAFHRFSENFHPDRHTGADAELRDAVRRIFMRGAEAYRVLKNPRLRAAYDLELRKATDARGAAGAQVRSLDELCQSAAGRLHARQAERALDAGRLRDAQGLLEQALRAEGPNAELRERLAAVRQLIELAGDA